MKIEELDLSVRAWGCLKRAGVDTVEQLQGLTDEELWRIRGMGSVSIAEIKEKLQTMKQPADLSGDVRPIDANALFFKLVNTDPNTQGRFCDGAAKAMEFIINAPTIDPESLRPNGWWEDEHGGKYANPRYRCSRCKERALYKAEMDLLGNWEYKQALTPSCPNCSCKMGG